MGIELVEITKGFKKRPLFHSFSYVFEKGKTYVILGDNGVGKSVLLRIICGFSVCDSGEVVIDGKQLGKEYDFIQNAGVCINSPDFVPYLSGIKNLEMVAAIKKICNKDDLYKWADIFEMKDEIDRTYRKYSMGTKQKLRLIQAFMEDPEYIILDEPFNGLDHSVKKKLIVLIQEEQKKGKTIILTSHYLEEVSQINCEILEMTKNHLEKKIV